MVPQPTLSARRRYRLTLFQCLTTAGILVSACESAGAQAAQPFSIQGSGLYTVQSFSADRKVGGTGIEVQARYNPGRLSYGLGYQYSSHKGGGDELKLSGIFFEPRFAMSVGSETVFPYLAGRAALLRQSSEFANYGKFSTNGHAFGLGGGLLWSITYRLNLDLGAAVIRQAISEKTFSSGPPATFPAFTGFVVKGGLTIGLGSHT